MKHFTIQEVREMDKIKRINLINAITGIKPANLVGTISDEGQTNLAIISSVVHLGSSPALIGFFMRPTDEVPRHTFENIVANNYYTINHVRNDMIKPAHYTSAKFTRAESEFDQCGFTAIHLDEHPAPYVLESNIKFGLKLEEIIDVKSNGTKLIVGTVKHIYLESSIMDAQGQLDLEQASSVGVSGISRYYDLKQLEELPYARVTDWKGDAHMEKPN